jgi:hypothetical protein
MSESGNISYTLGALTVKGSTTINGTMNLNEVRLNRSSITQGSSLTTAVTLNSPAGFISTYSAGTLLTTNGSASFTVNNSYVSSDSIILSNIVNFSGGGAPSVRVGSVADGSFSVVLRNGDWITPLSGGSVKIGFSIL